MKKQFRPENNNWIICIVLYTVAGDRALENPSRDDVANPKKKKSLLQNILKIRRMMLKKESSILVSDIIFARFSAFFAMSRGRGRHFVCLCVPPF